MPLLKQPARRPPRSFYLDPPDQVARKLLGKLLVRLDDSQQPEAIGRIVEVEAYFHGDDAAAHSFAGKTARNAVVFGPPGHAYVYFVYGMHYCLNVSCEAEGRAGCVLFRALEPVSGMDVMASNRSRPVAPLKALTSGPARLCQAFGITRARDNAADFTAATSPLQIREDDFVAGEIAVTPRIGITKSADRLARYYLAGNPFVSS